MMELNKTAKDAALRHARECYPREACGLIVVKRGRRVYVPCENRALTPGEHFVIAPEDFARAEDVGEVVGVFHSHPDAGHEPSEADLHGCNASGLPWHIVSLPVVAWSVTTPTDVQTPPLYGREFVHGVADCYSFVRDWYAQELGIALADGSREDEWWKKGQNLYLDRYEAWGFKLVKDGTLEPGDVILMQVLSDVPNHAAVYLGNDVIGHHLYGRLSSREVYGGYYRKHASHVVRYAK